MALKMSAYLQKRLLALPPDQIERMFRTDRSRNPQTEFGGMADVLSELYSITGDKKQLALAALFNRPWLIDPLAANEDRLKSPPRQHPRRPVGRHRPLCQRHRRCH